MEQPDHATPMHIRRIWSPPDRGFSKQVPWFAALGVVAAWGIGFFLNYLVCLVAVGWAAGTATPDWVVGCGALCGGGVACIAIGLVAYRDKRRYRRRVGLRWERLQRLAGRTDAIDRAPHRLIEWAILRHTPRRIRRRKPVDHAAQTVLPKVPPGWVILLDDHRSSWDLPPRGPADAFEPISVHDRNGAVELLRQAGMQRDLARSADLPTTQLTPRPFDSAAETADAEPTVAAPGPGANDGSDHAARRRRKAFVVRTLTIIAYLGILSLTLARNPRRALPVGITMFLLIAGPIVVLRWVLGRNTWLVPGGAALVDQAAWHRQPRIRYLQRQTSPLLLNADTGKATAVLDGRAITVPGGVALWLAWTSSARPPTRVEIQSFLNAEE